MIIFGKNEGLFFCLFVCFICFFLLLLGMDTKQHKMISVGHMMLLLKDSDLRTASRSEGKGQVNKPGRILAGWRLMDAPAPAAQSLGDTRSAAELTTLPSLCFSVAQLSAGREETLKSSQVFREVHLFRIHSSFSPSPQGAVRAATPLSPSLGWPGQDMNRLKSRETPLGWYMGVLQAKCTYLDFPKAAEVGW